MPPRSQHSAGLLLFTRAKGALEVLLAHPGGPFFARKDEGAWSIPKGEVEAGETAEACALREFEEETGMGGRPRACFHTVGKPTTT
jgi:predicted NUDIX family NTP pyrophosphohydrolase